MRRALVWAPRATWAASLALASCAAASRAPAPPAPPAPATATATVPSPASAAAASPTPSPPPGESALDRRIAFYEAKLVASPRHYPSAALLAGAELDKAKETGDPRWLARARASVARSMQTQANFQAMKVGVAIASYSHHFAEAVAQARAAREVYPADSSVAGLEVEALLGLGDAAGAVRALASFPADDFHAAFARGLVAMAERHHRQAAATYERAAAFAANEQVPELERFALVSAAGAFLDSGDASSARPLLARAQALPGAADDARLALHLAEELELQRRPAEALAAFEALLLRRDDAELHRQCARLARQLGDAGRAGAHFTAARALYQRALAAGEIYPLEGYSLLLSEAGVEPALALELARKNLEHKRDASAQAALQLAQPRAER